MYSMPLLAAPANALVAAPDLSGPRPAQPASPGLISPLQGYPLPATPRRPCLLVGYGYVRVRIDLVSAEVATFLRAPFAYAYAESGTVDEIYHVTFV